MSTSMSMSMSMLPVHIHVHIHVYVHIHVLVHLHVLAVTKKVMKQWCIRKEHNELLGMHYLTLHVMIPLQMRVTHY
jgi:hypothetical protein